MLKDSSTGRTRDGGEIELIKDGDSWTWRGDIFICEMDRDSVRERERKIERKKRERR